MTIHEFAALYALPNTTEKALIGDGYNYSIAGGSGYIAAFADTAGQLSAGIVTLSRLEHAITKLRLTLCGCKILPRPRYLTGDRLSELFISAEFNPANKRQAELVIRLAIFAH